MFSQAPQSSSKVPDQETQIRELVGGFYRAIEKQDCTLFFNYFTPPRTEQEIKDYQWAIGADLPQPMCRAFMRIKVSESNIQRITKISETNYRVEVNDKFQGWNNADPVGWTEPSKREMIIVFVNVSGRWKIDKYFPDCGEPVCGGGNVQTDKYSGTGQ